MTKYYKQFNEDGEMQALISYDFAPNISSSLFVEISEEEYNEILAELMANLPEPEEDEIALKAQAYDIIRGVSE